MAEVKKIRSEMIQWRRFLHQHPELSFHEKETAQFVYDTLHSFGGIQLSRPTETSVVGRIMGNKPGKTLAIRADMDALPIDEKNTFDFKSVHDGVMHACGHDGHTAMLLGTAKLLNSLKEELAGEVRLIFQHAEEVFPGGAKELVQAGVLENVDWVIGAHLWSPLASGKIGIVYGPMMASPDVFHITVEGKGGHGGMPQQTVDSIAIASQVVTNLQHLVSRQMDPIDPVVVSVTKFISGTTHNVIPGTAELTGTVRLLDPHLRDTLITRMEQLVKGITAAHGAGYRFTYEKGYAPVINHPDTTKVIEETVKATFGADAIEMLPPTMGGEDFSAYQEKKPGTFIFIGIGNREKESHYPHHHERFTIDEDALEVGVKLFVAAAYRFLNT